MAQGFLGHLCYGYNSGFKPADASQEAAPRKLMAVISNAYYRDH